MYDSVMMIGCRAEMRRAMRKQAISDKRSEWSAETGDRPAEDNQTNTRSWPVEPNRSTGERVELRDRGEVGDEETDTDCTWH